MSDTPEHTQRQNFEALAKRLVAVPKSKVDAAQKEWKKTKHKRGASEKPY
jgi:hypothetical protein